MESSEDAFVKEGFARMAEFLKDRAKSKPEDILIAVFVTKSNYELVLRAAFRDATKFDPNTRSDPRAIRFDGQKMMFFVASDNHLIVPVNLLRKPSM